MPLGSSGKSMEITKITSKKVRDLIYLEIGLQKTVRPEITKRQTVRGEIVIFMLF